MRRQSIAVRDVDLSVDDVSRLRRAWETSANSGGCDVDKSRVYTRGDILSGGDLGDAGETHSPDVRLVYAGKDLEKGQPLQRYGLRPDSTVHVLGRLRGGAQLGKVVKGRSQVRQLLTISVLGMVYTNR